MVKHVELDFQKNKQKTTKSLLLEASPQLAVHTRNVKALTCVVDRDLLRSLYVV